MGVRLWTTDSARRLTAFLATAALVLAMLTLWAPRAQAALSVPSGLSPSAGSAVTDVPVFAWDAVPDAAAYDVEVYANEALTDKRFSAQVRTTSAGMTVDLAPGTYYWHARAVGADNAPGEFSDAVDFSRDAVAPPVPGGLPGGPAVDHPDTAPVFNWTPMSGVKSYDVQWSTNTGFTAGTNESVANATTVGASYTPTDLLQPGRDYYWRARAKYATARTATSTQDTFTEYSPTQTFRMEWGDNSVPTLVSPANNPSVNSPVTQPEMRWTPVPGAAMYKLQVSASPVFNPATLKVDKTLVSNAYVPTESLPAGSYYWQVATVDANGSMSDYSPVWQFYNAWLDHGQLARPTVHVTDADPAAPGIQMYEDEIVVSWDPIPGASHYEVRFSTDPSFTNQSTGVMKTCKTASTTITPVFNGKVAGANNLAACDLLLPHTGVDLFAVGSVYVQVTAVDKTSGSGEITSLTSDQARPGEAAPGPTQLLLLDRTGGTDIAAPAVLDGPATETEHTTSPVLRWNRVAGANRYLVFITKDQDFTVSASALEPIREPATTYLATSNTRLNLLEQLPNSLSGESYYWLVVPCASWTDTGANSGCVAKSLAINVEGRWRTFRKVTPSVRWLQQQTLSGIGATGKRLTWTDAVDSEAQYADADTNPGHFYENGGTKYYEVEISTDSGFNEANKRLGPILKTDATSIVPEASWNPTETYYAHVRAVDGGGAQLGWSDTLSFNYVGPSAPTGLGTAGAGPTKTLTWQAIPGAQSYDVEVYLGGDPLFPGANRRLTGNSEFPGWTPTSQLAAGDYSWRVRSVDANGMKGAWSSGVPTFTVGTPETTGPPLTSPVGGATVPVSQLSFQWGHVPGAASYTIQVSKSADFATIFDSKDTTNTRWSPLTAKDYQSGTYYWRTLARSTTDVLAQSSEPTVHLTTVPGKPGTLKATTSDTERGAVTLSWTAPTDTGGRAITGYRAWLRPKNGTWTGGDVIAGDQAARTINGLPDSGDYEFRVAAVNADGTGEFSNTASAKTASEPGAPTSARAKTAVGGFTATWSKPSSKPTATLFDVRYRVSGGEWVNAQTADTTYSVTGLGYALSCEFQVRAINVVGPGPWASVVGFTTGSPPAATPAPTPRAPATTPNTPTTTPRAPTSTPAPQTPTAQPALPKAPSSVRASAKGKKKKRKLTISWSAVTGATGYGAEISRNKKSWKSAAVKGTTAKVKSKKGKTYYVRVRARNAKGWGAYSTVVTARG